MGSGEADAVRTTNNIMAPLGSWDLGTNTYPDKVYHYQIRCPHCDKLNWGQINFIISCKGCNSTLRAVSTKADYEVQVEN